MRNFIFIFLLILAFTGCVTPQHVQTPQMPSMPAGVYHKVLPSQTLWRISRAYQISVEDIVKANKIEDPTKIQDGQLILIPGAKKEIDLDQTTVPESAKGEFIWPVEGKVAAFYGTKFENVLNKGIDIECPVGVQVKASSAGIVSYTNDAMRGYGKVIIIDHNNDFSTVYAHNSEILVKQGQEVPQGLVIAKGRYLHFEIRRKHEPQNPFYNLP